MKTIEEYEAQAREILSKRYSSKQYPPATTYFTTEITDTITQLMMRDAMTEILEIAQALSFDHFGRLIVKVEHDE